MQTLGRRLGLGVPGEQDADRKAGSMVANRRPPLVRDYPRKKTNTFQAGNRRRPSGYSVDCPPEKCTEACRTGTLQTQNHPKRPAQPMRKP